VILCVKQFMKGGLRNNIDISDDSVRISQVDEYHCAYFALNGDCKHNDQNQSDNSQPEHHQSCSECYKVRTLGSHVKAVMRLIQDRVEATEFKEIGNMLIAVDMIRS